MSVPIFGFIHVMQANHWRDIVKELTGQIESSGLYQAVDRIFVGYVGACPDHGILVPSKYEVAFHHPNVLEYEYPTLCFLQTVCGQNTTAKVFYMHTKGASKPYRPSWAEGLRQNYTNAVVQQWRFCVWLLDTYDIAGPLWNGRHFSGNFWWANARYILTLPRLSSDPYQDRFQAENWIGSSAQKKVFDVPFCWGPKWGSFESDGLVPYQRKPVSGG